MALKSLPDQIDNATHAKLDKAVSEGSSRHIRSSKLESFADCVLLLRDIIRHSDGYLYSNKEAEQLIETHEDLQEMLAAAWESKTYRSIRNLAILRNPVRQELALMRETPHEFHHSLSKSFKATFHGAAVDGFYEYLTFIEKQFRKEEKPLYYAKFCSIVQSSGTGKSRILTELGKKDVIVLYMNLSGDEEKRGFPLRDPIPAKILTEFPPTEHEYLIVCYAFFIALFDAVGEQLSSEHATSDSKTNVLRWARAMCDVGYRPTHTTRSDFFSELSRKYRKAHADLVRALNEADLAHERLKKRKRSSSPPDPDNTFPDIAYAVTQMAQQSANPSREHLDEAMTDTDATSDRSEPSESDSTQDPTILTLSAHLFVAFDKIITHLANIFPGKSTLAQPKLVIALDEAHPLTPTREKYRPADVFCRVVNKYSHRKKTQHAVWVVFASTTSKVADFCPPNPKHNSDRISVQGEKLFEPYTQLGWDQNAPGLRDIDVKDISRLDCMTGFGRPLWKSLQTSLEDTELLINTATTKLCGIRGFDPENMDHVLAVLGQRFALDVALGHPDSVEHLENGVASHMRICLSTTLGRQWRFTKYPSEPLLSYVAARALHDSPGALQTALNKLLRALNSGMIEKGQRGELASRLLWLLAKDLFIRTKVNNTANELPGTWDAHLADCQMIPVVDWLEFVFGPSMWNGKDGEDKEALQVARALFQNSYLNFSHWISMEADIHKSGGLGFDEWTLRHWMRTSAVQCCHQQPLIDKVIPIYFGSEHDRASTESQMSQIFISDKAKESTNSKRTLDFITRDKISGEPSQERRGSDTLPYIVILADLGQPASLSVTFPKRDRDDRRMAIYAGGVDPSTYPFLANHDGLRQALEQLVHIAQAPDVERAYEKYLDAQVKFGSTATAEHMSWERGKLIPVLE